MERSYRLNVTLELPFLSHTHRCEYRAMGVINDEVTFINSHRGYFHL